MSVLKKVFLLTIFIICISFSFCFAIDENQLSPAQPSSTEETIDDAMSINTDENNSNTESNLETEPSVQNASVEDTSNPLSDSSSSDTDTQTSTTVSSVSSVSKTSTITNIINIGLLVVGILLIFLAIAILIRLNS